jgi:predicted nucleic acid-binding protein
VPVALEYEDVLKREFMQSVITAADVEVFLDFMISKADLFEVKFRLRPTLRDPDDDRILELAARAGASIVTFNTSDFVEAVAYKIPVLRPVEFLQQIGEFR